MSIARFYCSAQLTPDSRLALPDALAHHAVRVLRLCHGDAMVLFDGRGGEYPATLELDGRQAWALTGAHDTVERELRGALTLLQGIASGDKMDWIVEKAVELGAARLVPIAAERSVLRLSGPRLDKRLERWRAIARAAGEQCGRNRLMDVAAPASLSDILATLASNHDPVLFCHPDGALPMKHALTDIHERLSVLVGPEGGWSQAELDCAARTGLTPVTLGPRVLRTETAGLALIATATALLDW